MPGRDQGEENEEEQEQGAASRQMGPPAPGGLSSGFCFLILRGFRVQILRAVERGISIHRTIEADLFSSLRAESCNRCRGWNFVNGDGEREVFGKKKKRRTARERTQGPFKEMAREGTLERNSPNHV